MFCVSVLVWLTLRYIPDLCAEFGYLVAVEFEVEDIGFGSLGELFELEF